MNLKGKENLMVVQAKNSMSYKVEEIKLDSNFCTMTYLLILRKRKCNPRILQVHYVCIQGMSSLKKNILLKFGKTEHIMKIFIHNLTPKIVCLSSTYFKMLLCTFIAVGFSVM